MLGLIITLAIVGLFVGFIARALVPGRDHMSIPATLLLGVVGSFVGGLIGWLIHGHHTNGAFHTSVFLGSIVGTVITLLVYNAVARRRRAVR